MSIEELEKLLDNGEFEKKLEELADIKYVIEIPSEKWIHEAILEVIEKVKPPSRWRELIKWYLVGVLIGFILGLILPF